MIIASNWHPQKHLNYLSATVTQRAKFFLSFGKLSILFFFSFFQCCSSNTYRPKPDDQQEQRYLHETLFTKYFPMIKVLVILKK